MIGEQDVPRGHNGTLKWVTCAPFMKLSMDSHIRSKPLYALRTEVLTEKGAIFQRWSEHFEGLFSNRRTVQESSPAKIP